MAEPRITDPDAFLRSLYSPVPASKAFFDEIDKKLFALWRDGLARVTELQTTIVDLRSVAARAEELRCPVNLVAADRRLFRELTKAMDGLMRSPAADMGCLDFKRRHVGWNKGSQSWRKALAADEARVRPGGRLRRLAEPCKAKEARP